MRKRYYIAVLMVLGLGLSVAWGQNGASPQEPGATPDSSQPQQPVPAYGPDNNPAPPVSENPPISGLDTPNLVPHAAPLSYLQPGAHATEAIDSNIANGLGGSSARSVSTAEGTLKLQRLWRNYDLSLDYLGGVGYYNARGVGLRQVEELALDQRVTWKRGQLAIRDSFSYQPEGTFGSSYGSGGSLGGGTVFFGGSSLGSLGQVPRILNVTLVDVTETLTPKSSITLTGAYAFAHFLENDPATGNSFIGNGEVSGEVGYDRLLGPHDQGALIYGYQGFNFSTGVTLHTHIIQVMWGHRISGRMDFRIGAGPQFVETNHLLTPVGPTQVINSTCVVANSQRGLEVACPENNLRISAAGRASLLYRFPKVNLDLSYEHFTTSGSGLFAGAESDIAVLSANRALGRKWELHTDLGYSRNSRLLPSLCATGKNCSGVSANVYEYGFAGASVNRRLGRNFRTFIRYQFNDLFFDSSFCPTSSPCNRTSKRQVGTIGLDWIPRPIRLD